MSASTPLPTFEDVVLASRRISGFAHRTPVMHSRYLNQTLDAEVFFKCENLQRMGAFKFRGAFNALSKLTDAQRRAGVIAYSSGNHAQAVALSAQILQTSATILMPHDASAAKLDATRGYGAAVIGYDRYQEDAMTMAEAITKQDNKTFIPPFDHPDVLSGQGTSALELFEDVGDLDALFVCLGGGGLLSGCALAARALSPQCRVYGVEPLAGNDVAQSFAKGERVRIATPQTIADGAQTPMVGEITFAIIQKNVDAIFTVTDEQLIDSMRFYAERMKLVVEPTGCLSLAAALQMSPQLRGKKVGVIISGGNVDAQRYAQLLSMASSNT
ncbi:MAG: threo-3-hydroxy-L-aspartate ammonia-lyase [Betaproteobacteria bacterium]|nr:threo-3-hydroxy-L-aspartate ammonia-lyase [Betaproteobacteria bacterium]NBT67525.1 threo-3-hydroxy-L-aspartate ammonia-lyase [Betaproteobacteria bacterium]NBY06737.1 threo-3-hydroxy-L-aspartate ammonia-lyase [Betaproteobacteria bacterium]